MNMELEGGNMVEMEGDELMEAHGQICKHIFNFINSMSLKCAIQLGIPDAIHSHGPSPLPLSRLVSSLQLHPNKTQFIYRLMRLLTHSGFFVLQEEGYVLTTSSHLLLKDNSCTLSPFLLSMLQPVFVEPSHFLSAWFRTDDQTPFETAHGKSFWEFVGNKRKDGDTFNAGMASDARLVMSVLMGKHTSVFEGVESLVDVGGGTGTMAKAIAKAFPQIECTVLDLPQVVAELKPDIPNFKYVEGDMFDAIPPADALLLKVANILTKPLSAHSFIPLRVKLGVTHAADFGLRGILRLLTKKTHKTVIKQFNLKNVIK
ncbi:trans-resveratrol di-O-methyltransferase isoform X2 [Cucumis sativus]|nr:trans-resveratrol di-O-methyltransferase isoform X2 [Cucumis sativus]KAE8645731.1 hypothetical protein Csa_020240 [Cucumis sativus]